jgi:hypothetical protein
MFRTFGLTAQHAATAAPAATGTVSLVTGGPPWVAALAMLVSLALLVFLYGAPAAHAWIGVWRDMRGTLPPTDPRYDARTVSPPPTIRASASRSKATAATAKRVGDRSNEPRSWRRTARSATPER